MRPTWLAAVLLLACNWGGDRIAEELYARRVTDVLLTFEKAHRAARDACNRGPVECAVAASDGVEAVRRARADLAAASPPAKLVGTHRNLLLGLDHLAQAYQEIADTYWDRSQIYESYVRSVRSLEKAVRDVGAAALVIGFKGDRSIWTRR